MWSPVCGDQCVFAAWLWSADGHRIAQLTHEYLVLGARWNSDESAILTWSEDGTAKIWTNEGELVTIIPYQGYRGQGVHFAQWGDDETVLLVSKDGALRVWGKG